MSDPSKVSVYASFDAAAPDGKVVVVAINRTNGASGCTGGALTANVSLKHTQIFGKAHAWQLTSGSAYVAPSVIPTALSDIVLPTAGPAGPNAFSVSLPYCSVTTFALVP